jgi:hypothetical protein
MGSNGLNVFLLATAFDNLAIAQKYMYMSKSITRINVRNIDTRFYRPSS